MEIEKNKALIMETLKTPTDKECAEEYMQSLGMSKCEDGMWRFPSTEKCGIINEK